MTIKWSFSYNSFVKNIIFSYNSFVKNIESNKLFFQFLCKTKIAFFYNSFGKKYQESEISKKIFFLVKSWSCNYTPSEKHASETGTGDAANLDQ